MLKITSGYLKGRCIQTPLQGTRPTLSHVREALFNILYHRFSIDFLKVSTLDAFSGSGVLTFEAISRGVKRAHVFEKVKSNCEVLQKNAEILGVCPIVYCQDFLHAKPSEKVDLIFLDPPYGKFNIENIFKTLTLGWIKEGTLVALESLPFKGLVIPDFIMEEKRVYGKCCLSFWKYTG